MKLIYELILDEFRLEIHPDRGMFSYLVRQRYLGAKKSPDPKQKSNHKTKVLGRLLAVLISLSDGVYVGFVDKRPSESQCNSGNR